MTDLRALCARMADELDHYRQLLMDDRRETHALAAEARAALAKPEPQGPDLTACDLLERFIDYFWDEQDAESFPNAAALVAQARALLAQPEPQGPSDEALASFTAWFCRNYPGPDTIIHKPEWHAPKVFRAAESAIARWGRPAIEPAPVSERLPGPEDCDVEGRCWWWYPPRAGDAPTYGYWAHEDDATDRAHHEWPAAWLPHWALPVPAPANTINQNNY